MSTPTVTYLPQKLRGKTSSLDYNTFTLNVMNDIATLYKRVAEQESNIDEYYKIMSLQQIYIQKQYQDIIAKYYNIKNMLQSYSNASPEMTNAYISFYDDTNVVLGGFPSYPPILAPCDIDTQYGLLQPHIIGSKSRIYMYDDLTQQSFLPVSVNNYKITDKGEGIIRLLNPDYSDMIMKPLSCAFDGREDTYWFIQGKYASPAVKSMEIMIDLPLPLDVISTLNCNSILIEPFPAFATEIVGVYYTIDDKAFIIGDAVNNTDSSGISQWLQSYTTKWHSLPISTADLYPVRNCDTKIIFQTMPVTGIRVHLKTNMYTVESGLRTFIIGVRNIDCNYSQFSGGHALVKLTIGSKCFKNVLNPALVNASSNITYRLFYDQGYGDISNARFGATLPGGIKTIYIETAMEDASSLYGLNLQYNVY